MSIQIEGFAIVSEDGMMADANGVMPSGLIIEADQKFLSDGLDRVDFLVHGRHSHEHQPPSGRRRRLIASRTIEAIEPRDEHPNALLWNPAGISLDKAAEMLGISQGKAPFWAVPKFIAFSCRVLTCFTFRAWPVSKWQAEDHSSRLLAVQS